jgi:hypothetical protein
MNDDRLYEKLKNMTDEECEQILDPICYAVRGKANIHNGIEVMANRIFALMVLELYETWQKECYGRD